MPVYYYQCANCSRNSTLTEYLPEVECECSIGVQAYTGMLDDHGITWTWFPQDMAYYVAQPDGTWVWLDNATQTWHQRGTYPVLPSPPTPPAVELDVVDDAVEALQLFPQSTEPVEACRNSLAQHGMGPAAKKAGTKAQARQIIVSEAIGGSRHEAWQMLERWNAVYAGEEGQPIAAQEVGQTAADGEAPAPVLPVAAAPAAAHIRRSRMAGSITQ